jgi:transcriptional regulator with XRE-family HTH domain
VDRDKPQTLLGAIIRQQRELAALPMRQLAKSVGISNPYLSQIERGLRAPSEAVVEALAAALGLSAEDLYHRAGFVEPAASDDDPARSDLAAAIAAAPELTAAQRRAMAEIHRSFVDANRVRRAAATALPAAPARS